MLLTVFSTSLAAIAAALGGSVATPPHPCMQGKAGAGAESGKTTVIRTGSGHSATIVRSVPDGTIRLEQRGKDHAALAIQSGRDEDLSISQEGSSSSADVTQDGACNRAELEQVGSRNAATLRQKGSGNRVVVYQGRKRED